MHKAIKEVKRLPAGTNFYEDKEISEESQQDLFTETKKPLRALLELTLNQRSINSLVNSNGQLIKKDRFKINRGEIDMQVFPNPMNWNIADGDYKNTLTENEKRQVYSIEKRRKLEKILFGVTLVLAALIILLFSFMASSIKNF